MSSSLGVGTAAKDTLDILPPELIRFMMVRIKVNTQINFDPSEKDTIPNLFDDYQRASDAYFNKGDKDLARIFELSQIGEIKKPPSVRFSILAQWVQMPNMEEEIEKESLSEWAKYARVWLDRFAPEDQKFEIQEKLPKEAKSLSDNQKELLSRATDLLDQKLNPEEFQTKIYELGKELGLSSQQAFEAFYKALIGKNHGPKAAWLILSLDRDFVKRRFEEAAS